MLPTLGSRSGRHVRADPRGGHGTVASRNVVGRCAWDDQPMGQTVLVVDDHADFRSAARALLEAEGFEVWARRRTAPKR